MVDMTREKNKIWRIAQDNNIRLKDRQRTTQSKDEVKTAHKTDDNVEGCCQVVQVWAQICLLLVSNEMEVHPATQKRIEETHEFHRWWSTYLSAYEDHYRRCSRSEQRTSIDIHVGKDRRGTVCHNAHSFVLV